MTDSITETLRRDRQRRLLDDADCYRLARQASSTPAPVRARAGWLLVRAGLRLVRDRRVNLAGGA